ncbi:tail fiber assembly protein [Pseudomonas sp. R1-15]|uniref:tail fiber assembly protein n=1 Tax=Pseudomonas sp. R1-15 TaxID=2817399 RepID=UPI003DA91B1C
MKTYARIYKGRVAELFCTEGNIGEMFHPSFVWVDVSGLDNFPEYRWEAVEQDGGWKFSKYVSPPSSEEQLKAEAMAQRDIYMEAANEATIGMADAYIAGFLNEADTAKFKAFAVYKLALNKINQQPGFPGAISWPISP